MDSLHISAVILARMALEDGALASAERDFLAQLCARLDGVSLEQLLDQARTEPLDALVARLDRYEDRFFIALRAYMMAHIDAHFDAAEEALFTRLVDVMALSPEDRALIERAEQAARAVDPQPPEPRLLELFAASSFNAAGAASDAPEAADP